MVTLEALAYALAPVAVFVGFVALILRGIWHAAEGNTWSFIGMMILAFAVLQFVLRPVLGV